METRALRNNKRYEHLYKGVRPEDPSIANPELSTRLAHSEAHSEEPVALEEALAQARKLYNGSKRALNGRGARRDLRFGTARRKRFRMFPQGLHNCFRVV